MRQIIIYIILSMNELTEFSQQCTREAQLELFFPFHEGAELREMQRLARVHTAGEQWTWSLNQGGLIAKPAVCT